MSRLLRSKELTISAYCWHKTRSVSFKASIFALFFILLGVGKTYAQSEFPCEISITCPDAVTVECGSNLQDLDLTGSPLVDAFQCFSEISITHSDAVISDNGCVSVITRTWVASVVGGPSDMCTQTITVADTQGPVFIDAPADATYQCRGDVPDAPILEATDCSGFDVVVFEPETGTDTLDCTLTTPIGPGPDWSVWLNGLASLGLASGDYYNWVPGTATMTSYDDGTAYLTGDVANMTNPSETWTVHFWMQNGRNWSDWSSLGRSYKNDLGFGTATHQNWAYYELVPVFSHFVGTGANAGNSLYLSHQPANYYFGFQFGQGANNRNGNEGGSGWFYYWGSVNGQSVSNHGDLTTDKECVPVEHPNITCESTITRMWTATDACGNVSFADQVITIHDDVAPVFQNCPSDVTIQCNVEEIPAAVDASTLIAIDNCLGNVEVNFTGTLMPEGSPCAYDIVHTYEAVDTCGNRAACSYTIHVVDTQGPVVTAPADATFECDQEIVWASATAFDLCQGDVSTSEFEAEYVYDECGYHIIRTFYANDGCDNYGYASQTIWITDTTAPVFSEFPVQLYVECDQLDTIEIPSATDNCDETVVVTYEDITNSGGCLGVIMRTFTASDDCGNTATAVQYITIQDTTPAVIDEPADMTVECSEVPDAPGVNGANVYDNCGYEVNVEFHTEMMEGDCANSYTILWIWEATDYCENYSTDTTVITVVDTTNPTLNVPQGGTFSCDEDVVYGNASASDNCDDQVEITYEDFSTPGDCPQAYSITRSWTAVDNCGNYAYGTTTYYVVDQTAPVFTSVPEDITIECDVELPATFATATDNCGVVTVTSNDYVYYESPCFTYIIRTFTATDECGNYDEAVQGITIVDTTAPVIDYVVEIERPCDDYSGIYATATDNCTEFVEVFWVGDELASGGCMGRVIRTYGAYDACDNYTEVQQFITLTDDVAPVIVNAPENITVECGDEIPAYNPIWTDNCDQELSYSAISGISIDGCNQIISEVYYAEDHCGNQSSVSRMITIVDTTDPYFGQLPSDMTINCYETVPAIVTPEAFDTCDEVVDVEVTDEMVAGECPNEYTINRVYRATDDCGNQAVETRYIYVVDNDAPVFEEAINEFAYECDDDILLVTPVAVDACGATTLDHSDFWEVESDCYGLLIRTWSATDECFNTSYFTQYISIYDETAPVISGEFEINMPCDQISDAIFVTATDNCDTDVNIYIWSDELASGGCAGRIIRTYRAYDNCDNYSEFTQFITLTDETAPVANIQPEDAAYECDQEWTPAQVYFTDNCDQELVTVPSVTLDSDGCTSVYHYTWTATDGCGNSSSVDQIITVTDTTAPTSNYYPEDFTVECGNFWDLVLPVFSDNCDMELTYDSGSNEEVVDCNTILTFWWSATDDCGNTLYLDQVVTIVDTTPPTLIVPEGNEFSCVDGITYGEAFAYDACDQNVTLDYSDEMFDGNCPQSYSVVRTWTATDDCGNVSTGSATYYVYDNVAPEFTSVPEDVTYECSDEILPSQAYATDNCDLEVAVSQSDFYYYQTECYSIIIRTFEATDDCGNSTVASQIITIVDTTAPVIDAQVQITMPCDNISTEILATATDNCDQDVTVFIVSEEYNSGSCAGVIVRVYGAWDNCDNYSEFTQYITLTDNTAPVASIDPEDMTVECGSEWSAANVTFTDNCADELYLFPDLFVTSDNCTTTYHYIWTAVDNCDNSTTVDQYINVIDTQAPVIDDQNSETTVDCNVVIDFVLPDAWDACDGEVGVLPTYNSVDGDCDGYYTETITFTATDICGNSTTVTHIVHHIDVTAPILTDLPNNGEYSCDEQLPNDMPSAFDYCSAATVYSSEETIPGQCPNSYTVVRTFWAVDACGNMSEEESVYYYIYDNTNPEFVNEVTDENYECLDWATYDAQLVEATDNCGPATVTYEIIQLQGDDCGNGVWEVYYTATDLCFNTSHMSYYISIEDVTAPVLSELPASVMLDCGDELPAAPMITATDNCDQTINVSMTETCIGDCPVEGETDCDLLTPVRPVNNPCNYPVDWAMALFGMPGSHKWYQLVPGSGVLHHNGDGSITVSGTLVNAYNAGCGFTFNVTFDSVLDWADWSSQSFPTGFKADCGGEAVNHQTWMYYLLQPQNGAELIGWGGYAGSSLNLTHAPANHYFGFQLGNGANNYNGDNGLGGWFAYNGTFLVNGESIMSGNAAGAGDFAFNVDCCPNYQIVRCWSAMDCSGNETSWCQTISYGDLNSNFNPATPEMATSDEVKGDIAIMNIMPNPATSKSQISFMSKEAGRLSLQVMDMTGRIVADLYNNNVEGGIIYKADFDADRIPSGIYMVRLSSSTQTDIDRIQITK